MAAKFIDRLIETVCESFSRPYRDAAETRCYIRGQDAYREGKGPDANPCTCEGQELLRAAWDDGYYGRD